MACTVNAQDNAGLRLPAGFSATLFANNIGSSRHISITKSGIVFAKLNAPNKEGKAIIRLEDANKDILKESYNKVKYSVSNSNIKPILTGINYKINNDSLKVSSTDARRLSLTTFDFITNTEGEFTIFRPLLGILIKILEFTEHKEINLFYNSNQIIIEDGDTILKARLIEGNYPDITRLVPNEFKFSFNVDARKIYSILEKITILSDRDNGNVTLEIKDSQLIVKSYFKELGAIEEICNIDSLNGNPFNISFDPRFLMDSINSIGEDNINLGFVDEISPFKIVGLDKTDNIQIISPIRMT